MAAAEKRYTSSTSTATEKQLFFKFYVNLKYLAFKQLLTLHSNNY